MTVEGTSAKSWALFREQVDDTIIKAVQPKILYPMLTKTFPAISGVQEFNVTNSYISPEDAGESGEYPNKGLSWSRNKVEMRDIGLAPILPINWIKDSRWDLVNDHVEAIGFGIARFLNTQCLSTLNTAVAGGTGYGVTYTDITSTNQQAATAVWSASTADIVSDISLGLGLMEGQDMGDGKKYLVLNPSTFKYMRIDPNLLKYINYGDASLIQKGIYPTPFGVDILCSSQAATNYGLIVNADYSSSKYYEREPLTTEIEKLPRSKNLAIQSYIRFAFAVGRPKGVVKISSIA